MSAVPFTVFAPLLNAQLPLDVWNVVLVLQEVRELEVWIVQARKLLGKSVNPGSGLYIR